MKKQILIVMVCMAMVMSIVIPAALGSKEDNTYRVGINEDPGSMNPLFSKSASNFDVLTDEGGVFDDLLDQTYEDFQNGVFQPWIIKSWEFKNNDQTIVFQFRDDVLWHDGEKLTAKDMEFTYDVILSPESGCVQYVSDIEQWVERYRAVDEYIFEVDLKMRDPGHFQSIYYVTNIMLLPYHYFKDMPMEKVGFDPGYNSMPIGYGPYKIIDRKINAYVRVATFDDYWNKEKLPEIDTIIYKHIPETYPSWVAFKNEEINMITRASLYLEEFNEMKDAGKIDIYDYPSLYFGGYRMNFLLEDNPLQDKLVRQAVMYAMDRNLLCDVVKKGTTVPLQTIVTERYPGMINPDTKRYNYNLAKAKVLLKQAGYVDTNKDGYLDKDGKTLELIYPMVSGSGEEMAEWFKAMMRVAGIKVRVDQIDGARWRELASGAGEWHLIGVGATEGAFISDHLEFWFSTEGEGNRCGYSNSTLDGLFEAWENTLVPEEQKEIVFKIQDVIAEDVSFMYLSQTLVERAYTKGFNELESSPWGMESEVNEMYWI